MTETAALLTRSTGIVALALLGAALVWGFAFSAGETGRRLRPAWWLDLHNWLGGAAAVFTVVHVALAVGSGATRAVAALVPMVAGDDRVALGVGVLSAWTILAATLTTWPRRLRHRRAWHLVHLGSVVGAGLAVAHALAMGSDASGAGFRIAVLAALAPVVYLLVLRLLGAGRRTPRAVRT